MRPALRVLRAVAALGGAAALVVPAFTAPAGAADQTVRVGSPDNRFTPASVTIRPGDTVTWQYAAGSNHTVTSTSPNWSKNDPVGPPAVLDLTTSYFFDQPGTYRYVCRTHESVGMRGVVIVAARRPAATTSPRPTSSPAPTSSPRPGAGTSATPSATPTATPTPSASAGTALPTVVTETPPSAPPSPGAPLPSVAPPATTTTATEAPFLGSGGLTPHSPTGRGKGLPVMLALLLIGGIGSAELRALLANVPPGQP